MTAPTSAFADKITDYLLTRTVPWKEPDEIRDAVREAIRLTFTEARYDPDNPRYWNEAGEIEAADDYRDELQTEARQAKWEDEGL